MVEKIAGWPWTIYLQSRYEYLSANLNIVGSRPASRLPYKYNWSELRNIPNNYYRQFGTVRFTPSRKCVNWKINIIIFEL